MDFSQTKTGHDRIRWLKLSFWILAAFLGAIHALAASYSHSMNPDGIAYLDMGEAFLRGDWEMAVNAYWSPLYSWLLGFAMFVLNPSMRMEFPAVHLINFLIYLGTLVCFEFFWRQVTQYRQFILTNKSEENQITFPDWVWFSLGYILFIWTALCMIQVWTVTPDMCVAAFVYLAAGLIIRMRMGVATWRTFALLGIVLGLGYLAKAAMFLLSFVFLIISLFSTGNIRRAMPLVLISLILFLLTVGPFITAIYKIKGKLTFGDSGKLMYAWYVNEIPRPYWQGEVDGGGKPKHPLRKINELPPIYEFGTPVGGTYPLSYDPSYWYEGVTPHFDLRGQISVLLSNAQIYFKLFFRQQGVLIFGILILFLIMKRKFIHIKQVIQQGGLVIIAMVGLGMYALVHVQTRYIGAFVVLFWADLFAAIRLPHSPEARKLVSLVGISMLVFIIINIGAFNLEGLNALVFNVNAFEGAKKDQSTIQETSPPSWPGEVAGELHRLGIQRGDKVAVIGYAFDSLWARLAHVKIVAEMFGGEADPFWLGESSLKSELIQVFANTGAKAIVAENVPNYATVLGWHRVGNSNYYIYILVN